MAVKPWSVTEAFQNTWGTLLRDFHEWVIPDTDDLLDWCNRDARQAIGVCPSASIDDADAMLKWWRTNTNGTEGGSTAYLPVMLTTFEAAASIPALSNLMGVPYPVDVPIPNDPQRRYFKMRAIPLGIRAQVVFFAPNAHSASFTAAQFCAFMSDETKRRQILKINMADGLVSDWTMTIFDNELSPSISSSQDNLKGWSVDVTLAGLVPQLIRQRGDGSGGGNSGGGGGGSSGGGGGSGTGPITDQPVVLPVVVDSHVQTPTVTVDIHADLVTGDTTIEVQP